VVSRTSTRRVTALGRPRQMVLFSPTCSTRRRKQSAPHRRDQRRAGRRGGNDRAAHRADPPGMQNPGRVGLLLDSWRREDDEMHRPLRTSAYRPPFNRPREDQRDPARHRRVVFEKSSAEMLRDRRSLAGHVRRAAGALTADGDRHQLADAPKIQSSRRRPPARVVVVKPAIRAGTCCRACRPRASGYPP